MSSAVILEPLLTEPPPPPHTNRHAQKGGGLPHVFAFSFAIKMEVTREIKCLDERTSISQCDVLRDVMKKRVQKKV